MSIGDSNINSPSQVSPPNSGASDSVSESSSPNNGKKYTPDQVAGMKRRAEAEPLSDKKPKRIRPTLSLKLPDSSTKPSDPQVENLKALIIEHKSNTKSDPIKKGQHVLYPITGNGVKLYAHKLPRSEQEVCSLWSLARSEGVSKIVCLQRPGLVSPYVPEEIKLGEKITCTDGTTVKISEIPAKNKADFKSFTVQVTPANGDTSEPRTVHVDQVLNWNDDEAVPLEQAKSLVDNLPIENCQIHCEGGLGRTGALIVMKQLKMDKELTKANMMNRIAGLVADGRVQRERNEFVKTDVQLRLLIDFAGDLIKDQK
ncbi:MAG: protein-tyrosine phosphatase family protein [Endozoicomonas sp.]